MSNLLNSEIALYARAFAVVMIFLLVIFGLALFVIWLAEALGGLTDLRSLFIFTICTCAMVMLIGAALDQIFQGIMHG